MPGRGATNWYHYSQLTTDYLCRSSHVLRLYPLSLGSLFVTFPVFKQTGPPPCLSKHYIFASFIPSSSSHPTTPLPLIPYESNLPQLREAYRHNKSSFLHRLPPEIRNTIMEYAVSLEEDVVPLPVIDEDEMDVNKFVWGEFELREGILDGEVARVRFPTGPLAVVSLRLACRQFYHELEGVFYRVNTFSFRDRSQCEKYLSKLTIKRRSQIHKVCLDCTLPEYFNWKKSSSLSKRLFPSRTHWIFRVVQDNCPGVERLIINLGHRPGRLIPTIPGDPIVPFIQECSKLVWKQLDRNPARIIHQLCRYFEEVLLTIHELAIFAFPLSPCGLEFCITGSPAISVRLDGRMICRSSLKVPGYTQYMEREFEDTKRRIPLIYEEEWGKSSYFSTRNYADFSLGESTRIEQGPVPNLTNFQFPASAGDQELEIRRPYSIYDENGLLKLDPEESEICELIWDGEEIVCGIDLGFEPRLSIEPISRLASWEGLQMILDHYNFHLHGVEHPDVLSQRLQQLNESPSPKDVDAALRATGMFNSDNAPRDLLQEWEDLLNSQDRIIEELSGQVEWAQL
ncbi:hypothetical protein F4678DRAFT_478859 [Xylaria arbuscula]|nr:hypothetical protein F4678DRAFT_478859 [Xylaria arbuscula]